MKLKRNKYTYVRRRNPYIKQGAPVLYDGQLLFVSTVSEGDVILRRELRVHPIDPHASYTQNDATGQAIELIRALVNKAIEVDRVHTTLTGNDDMSLEEIEVISSEALKIVNALWRNYQTLPGAKE